jgi:hypothetical protein
MELNGVSNMKLTLERLSVLSSVAEVSDVIFLMNKHIVNLERYMLAYKDYSDKSLAAAMNRENLPNEPVWHDILANPEKFPTLKEKLKREKTSVSK